MKYFKDEALDLSYDPFYYRNIQINGKAIPRLWDSKQVLGRTNLYCNAGLSKRLANDTQLAKLFKQIKLL